MKDPLLSRRNFLKASLATGALAAASELPSFDDWKRARAASPPATKAVPTLCEMCGVKCGVIAQVRDGRVCRIDGNPKHPSANGKLCARGNAGVATLYDPDRLKQPLKRVAEGKFEPISWDKAFEEIGSKLRELKTKYGPQTLVWVAHPETAWPLEQHWNAAFGSPNLTGHAPTCYSSRSVSYNTTFGDLPAVDYANVKYYISPGRNLIEGINNGVVQKIAAAKANGAKIIALDPRMSNFAAWADEWLPIKPGTDGALLLALINVIIKENLYDKAFVRANAIGFEELKAANAQYTPEWATQITDIPAQTITRIARELAAARPAAAVDPTWHGGLGSMYFNAVQAGRAGACLNALLGNLGAKGGLVFSPGVKLGSPAKLMGPRLPKITAARWDGAGGEKWPLAKGMGLIHTLPEHILSGQPYPIKALFISHLNPVRSCPDTKQFLQAMEKLELIVAVDIQMSDTAYHAHYVLPESTYLERSDPVQVTGPTVAIRQPAINTLHNTREEAEILAGLAKAVGLRANFNFILDEYNAALLGPLGVSLEQLRREGVIKVPATPPNYGELKTPSGKIELFSSAIGKAGGSPVPVWVPPMVEPKPGEFRLLHGHVAMHTHTSTENNRYLHALMSENTLWINPAAAQRLGIADGDLVEVKSKLGHVQIKARVTQSIRPDSVFMAHGFGGLSPYKRLAYQKGANHSELVPILKAELSGAAAQCEVAVTVRKAG